ncbi:cell surface protein [Xylaria bambusicola]|uniref:cell surface protein n=1 Tax=Xylaria bambusicola TaxID=326684 RepID=UPI0020076B47|nr:cell surface protein [Xylaria bambusicola]KAI0528029.1 cell surface protein [Xylaria bambusicola]
MRYSYIIAASGCLSMVSGHGLVTSIQGANGVTMPGLSVADGTPRDCSSNGCGSQADTAIIRDRELGTQRASALGRTQGNGPIDASLMIANFMDASAGAPTNNGAASSAGVEDDLSALKGAKNNNKRGFLDGLFGGGAGGSRNQGTKSSKPVEDFVAASAGQGSASGLPTCSDDGSITMTFRQINQDGAGPLTADVDGTSGGTDVNAFQNAQVTQDVPGLPFGGLSLATNTDFPVTVQMPAGMTCDASVGGADNVCIVRVRNGAAAGPFGGSAAFTQSPAARKRAIAYRLKKRSAADMYQNRRLR